MVESAAPVHDADFLSMAQPRSDRLACLETMLKRRGLAWHELPMGRRRHILLRARPGKAACLLVAHYDSFGDSPGALDNAAACLVLANAAARMRSAGKAGGGVLFLFTDGEEAARSDPQSQGAYTFARNLGAALGGLVPPILVLDVVGRGGQPLISTAAREAIARGGGGEAGLPLAIDRIAALASRATALAGLPAPLALPMPWSDDLGFTLAGLPALCFSMLPESEARAYAEGLGGPGGRKPALPETWALLHSAADGPGLVEPRTLAAMEAFVLAFAEVAEGAL